MAHISGNTCTIHVYLKEWLLWKKCFSEFIQLEQIGLGSAFAISAHLNPIIQAAKRCFPSKVKLLFCSTCTNTYKSETHQKLDFQKVISMLLVLALKGQRDTIMPENNDSKECLVKSFELFWTLFLQTND